jgi:hypothetical protein
MRPGWKCLLGATLLVPGLLFIISGPRASYGDEPSRLGRLFRFGGGPSNPAPPVPPVAPDSGPSGFDQPPSQPFSENSTGNALAPRLVPQPRVSRPATESDPILTRITLVRSSDGNQFGMCLQIYADGTVLDSEGVHRLSPADLKPLLDVLQSGDLYRLKGHCGAPATDFVEQVNLIVYERSLGRLRANAFSYSGNPQGCDHAVRHMHAALEAIQAKISRPPPMATSGPSPLQAPAPQPPAPSGPSISLTPSN